MTTDELIAALETHEKVEQASEHLALAMVLRTAIARLRSAERMMGFIRPAYHAKNVMETWRSGAADPEEVPHGEA